MTKFAYTISEMVVMTGISRTTIYEEIKAGRLRVTKIGKRTIVTAEQVRAWLNESSKAKAA